MKEIEPGAGSHVGAACAALCKAAPSFMVFNGVRIEAHGGESPADLQAYYTAEFDRRREAYRASDEYRRRQAEAAERAKRDVAIRDEALAVVSRSGIRERHPWADGMGEISGFGGGYEAACRDMLYAGLAWLETVPGVDLQSKDAREPLDKVIASACPDCSGAMHGAVMNACMFIAKNGWDAYAAVMRREASIRNGS